MTDQRQALAYLLDDIHDGSVTEGGCDFEGYNRHHGPTDAVDKVLASEWLAEHDREVRRAALREAADIVDGLPKMQAMVEALRRAAEEPRVSDDRGVADA